jgi:hypothetical protein
VGKLAGAFENFNFHALKGATSNSVVIKHEAKIRISFSKQV